MQYLGTLDNPRAAQALVDYLALQQIDILVKPVGQGKVELYVDNPHYLRAHGEFATFIKNPHDQRYLTASWQRNADHNPLRYHSDGSNSLTKAFLAQGGWLTHGILLLCIVLFGLAHVSNINEFLRFPESTAFPASEPWRWLTPAFIHFSPTHIVFNLFWWWYLGGRLEKHFGAVFLFMFMLFTAVVSNFAQFITHHANNFGGLSGVVYALIGFCWLYGKLKPQQPITLIDALFGFSLFWLVLGFADVLWVSMANQAHLAGLLCGLGFAWSWHKLNKSA